MKGYISYDGNGIMRFHSEDLEVDITFSVSCNIHHIKKVMSYKKGRLTLKLALAYGNQPMEDITETYDIKKIMKIMKSAQCKELLKITKVKVEACIDTIEDYDIARFSKGGTAYARVFSRYTKDSGILFTDGDYKLISTSWNIECARRIQNKLINRSNSDSSHNFEDNTEDYVFGKGFDF